MQVQFNRNTAHIRKQITPWVGTLNSLPDKDTRIAFEKFWIVMSGPQVRVTDSSTGAESPHD